MRPLASLLLGLLIAGCGDTNPLPASLLLTPGQEAASWATTPAPARVQVSARRSSGATKIADQAWPASEVSAGSLTTGENLSFLVEIQDATGKSVIRGGTPVINADELSGNKYPVLCGRVEAFTRPTIGLGAAATTPVVSLLAGRYLFVASGTAPQAYDLATYAPIALSGQLPRAPGSAATPDGESLYLIDPQGATLLDLFTGVQSDVPLPYAAEVSGGATVHAPDGTAYVIGATRHGGDKTSAVLRIATDGSLTRLDLLAGRQGAAAAWVEGQGLAVAGGGADTIELLAAGASSFVVALTSAPTTQDAIAVSPVAGELWLAGGVDAQGAPAGSWRFALAAKDSGPAAGDPIGLLHGHGEATGGGALFTGETADGTHSFRVVRSADKLVATEIPLHAARKGATSIGIGDGYVVILGGTLASDGAAANDLELFTPAP
jgi:hypothetical protein